MNRNLAAFIILALLGACDMGSAPATKTKLDAVEVEPGSVSDAMILLDDSDIDGTSVDNSGGALTAEGAAAARQEAEQTATEATDDENAAADDDAPLPEDDAPAE